MQGWLFLSLLTTGSLFAITGLRQFFLSPWSDPTVNFIWFLVQVSPLLLTLPGLLRGNVRSTFILCLASLLFFAHGILIVFENAALAAAEVVCALALCGTTTMLVRKLRETQAAQEPQDTTQS